MPRVFTLPPDDLLPYTIEGQIATLDQATIEKTREIVTLTIDGETVSMPRAVIAKDADRKDILDENGRATYRYTTIYEALLTHLEQKLDREDEHGMYEKYPLLRLQRLNELNPIPIVCHQEHLRPVGVCRMCVVEVLKDGRPEAKLAPACHRILDNGIEVRTQATSERVKSTIRTLGELLMSDQPPAKNPEAKPKLHQLAERLGIPSENRFPKPSVPREKDLSSLIINVDHDACILCDACIRSCTDVKHNNVIGRNGRGYTANIGFDLNNPMGDSSCVACGECAVSCPTDALTFKQAAAQKWDGEYEPVRWQDLLKHPLFSGVSPKFLEWNQGSIVRRRYKKGDIVCREGDFGSSAFLIESGRFEVSIQSTIGHVEKQKKPGLLSGLTSYVSSLSSADLSLGSESYSNISLDSTYAMDIQDDRVVVAERGPKDIIIGEMTCLNLYPRSATVIAKSDGAELIEIMRNILYVLYRNKASREILDDLYRKRTFPTVLSKLDLFQNVRGDEARFRKLTDWLQPRLDLVRVDPGQLIFKQNEQSDDFYIVRVGYVRVSQRGPSGEAIVRDYIGPGGYFGEIAALTADPHSSFLDGFSFPPSFQPGRRTADCSAVDHLELVKIQGRHFRTLCEQFPEVAAQIKIEAKRRIKRQEEQDLFTNTNSVGEFLDQGLQNAQYLLVIDLKSCTRCDECTKACSDSHEGVTRLIREGLRYDKYLVASSCRSCQDPVCMVGCPVNSIHRTESLDIVIEDWCIGCGLCANNCPYGNINMHTITTPQKGIGKHSQRPIIQRKATTCDTCKNVVGRNDQPNCVYACPHDAAHRMSGQEFLNVVREEKRR